MVLWIVTTGNSDVQMQDCTNWEDLYDELEERFEDCHVDFRAEGLVQDKATKLYPIPARVLGEVYSGAIAIEETYYNDLAFPLLDTFQKIFQENSFQNPTKFLVLLTDQSQVFPDDRIYLETCPYWQDTCALQPILEKYFKENFEDIELKFATIAPQPEPNTDNPVPAGIDNWDAMLKTVGDTLDTALKELEVDREKNDLVYVSHQAGTPAISSAVQFLTVGQFKRVQFLVSNPLIDEEDDLIKGKAQLIRSSNYWKKIKFADITKLLDPRFDFSGAKDILQEFQNQYENDPQKELISPIVQILQVGEDCLNLDIESAKSFLNSQFSTDVVEQVEEDDRLLNIYTQCRIFWQLDRTANFLSLVSSFYEGVLERIVDNWGARNGFPERGNRFNKRNFIENLVTNRQQPEEIIAWEDILNRLKSFDFWCSYRNKLIHGANGISKQRLQEVWEQRNLNDNNDEIACQRDEIIENMAAILRNDLRLVQQEYFQKFVGEDADYYIYSAVRSFAIEQLEKLEKSLT